MEHASLRWTHSNRRIERALLNYRLKSKQRLDFWIKYRYYQHEHQFRAAVRYWTAVKSGYRQADFWHFV